MILGVAGFLAGNRISAGSGIVLGTGLGLSFCKNAMEAMNGTIRCNSVDGKFAEFIMEFPRVTTSKVDKLKSLINIKSR